VCVCVCGWVGVCCVFVWAYVGKGCVWRPMYVSVIKPVL
jgi:hypothetical protein